MEKKKKTPVRKPSNNVSAIDTSDSDPRFASVKENPLYRRVPQKQKRVDIDKRFESMFHDKQFKVKYTMDKRGRPMTTTSDEGLKRLYHLEDDAQNDNDNDEDDDDAGEEDQTTREVTKDTKVSKAKKSVSKSSVASASTSNKESKEKKQKKDAKSIDDDDEKEGKVKSGKTLSKVDKLKLHSGEIDYTRGEGIFADEESSSSDSSEDEVDEEELERDTMHEWGEMDGDAPRTEEATTRLALCNMDWDRLKAADLMVLFHSFLPPGGILKSVTIYPSEFGKERLAEEEINGPKELVESKRKKKDKAKNNFGSDDDDDVDEMDGEGNDDDDDDDDGSGKDNASDIDGSEDEDEGVKLDLDSDSDAVDDEEDEEGGGYNMEKLRRYQLNRLKYFYAVLEFDSKETADKVYTECDGMEYESSATRVDLRFIPDEMDFDDKPHDKCDNLPDAKKYRPRFFTTTALQQMKVDLTWDETDHRRKELTNRIFNSKENVEDDDIRIYLASSESESDNEGEKEADDDKKDPILKYKALLQSLENENKKKENDNDVDMEITWGYGLKEKASDLVKKKLEEKEKAKMTPWEEQLAKRREKRHTRKQEKGKSKDKKGSGSDSNSNSDSDSETKNESESESENESDENNGKDQDSDQPFSDDDVEVDMNDPFFKEELATNEIFKQKQNQRKRKINSSKDDDDEGNSDDDDEDGSKLKSTSKSAKLSKEEKKLKKSAELDLLLMDDNEKFESSKKHFSLKKIIDAESETGNKKKKKKFGKKKKDEKVEGKAVEDTFKVNVDDDRFNALYSSHLFNVDPSDPNYKKTKNMEAILSEKQKRRMEQRKQKSEKIPDQPDKPSRPAPISTGSGVDSGSEAGWIKSGFEDHDTPSSKISKDKAELAYLVKSIKGKAQNLQSKKAKQNFKKSKWAK